MPYHNCYGDENLPGNCHKGWLPLRKISYCKTHEEVCPIEGHDHSYLKDREECVHCTGKEVSRRAGPPPAWLCPFAH